MYTAGTSGGSRSHSFPCNAGVKRGRGNFERGSSRISSNPTEITETVRSEVVFWQPPIIAEGIDQKELILTSVGAGSEIRILSKPELIYRAIVTDPETIESIRISGLDAPAKRFKEIDPEYLGVTLASSIDTYVNEFPRKHPFVGFKDFDHIEDAIATAIGTTIWLSTISQPNRTYNLYLLEICGKNLKVASVDQTLAGIDNSPAYPVNGELAVIGRVPQDSIKNIYSLGNLDDIQTLYDIDSINQLDHNLEKGEKAFLAFLDGKMKDNSQKCFEQAMGIPEGRSVIQILDSHRDLYEKLISKSPLLVEDHRVLLPALYNKSSEGDRSVFASQFPILGIQDFDRLLDESTIEQMDETNLANMNQFFLKKILCPFLNPNMADHVSTLQQQALGVRTLFKSINQLSKDKILTIEDPDERYLYIHRSPVNSQVISALMLAVFCHGLGGLFYDQNSDKKSDFLFANFVFNISKNCFTEGHDVFLKNLSEAVANMTFSEGDNYHSILIDDHGVLLDENGNPEWESESRSEIEKSFFLIFLKKLMSFTPADS